MALTAVVIGAGWAAEGHVRALRSAGVDVIALCGRTVDVTRAVAERLGVREARFDWPSCLEELHPDIVTIATPADSHADLAISAAAAGCHVYCEKPLARSGVQARAMLKAVEDAGGRHAYGATSRYAPALARARSLIEDGRVGPIWDLEAVWRLDLPTLMPYSWFQSLQGGGGFLFNGFTHLLEQVLYLTGGTVTWATGRTGTTTLPAPVGDQVHDFREWSPLADASGVSEWRDVDADLMATVLAEVSMPGQDPTTLIFHASGPVAARHEDSLGVYGEAGALLLPGSIWPTALWSRGRADGDWARVPVDPAEPAEDYDIVQEGWNALMREFVGDVRGDGSAGYPTFANGCISNEIIDAVRARAVYAPLLQPL